MPRQHLLTAKNLARVADDHRRLEAYNREQHRCEAFHASLAGIAPPKLATTITLGVDHTVEVKEYLEGWSAHFESLSAQDAEVGTEIMEKEEHRRPKLQ